MRRVAIVHPEMGFGGSEASVVWLAEELAPDYGVTILTTGSVDLKKCDEVYGTRLAESRVRVRCAPVPSWLPGALRFRFFQRFCQRVNGKFDVMVSAYNPVDFGKKGIQRLGDFGFDREARARLDGSKSGGVRGAYDWLCDRVSAYHSGVWKRNVTVANSRWSAKLFKRRYGQSAAVIYPPVADMVAVPWRGRKKGFVYVGRITPEKRVERIVRVLERVRSLGHDVTLTIVGEVRNDAYGRHVRELQKQRAEWVFLAGFAGLERKRKLLAGHRFAMNARPFEPFGISVAEMVKAGCVTFAPDGGGQAEVVGCRELLFRDEDDAVRKIDEVLRDEVLQRRLHEQMLEQGRQFSVTAFRKAFRGLVEEFESTG